MVLVALVYLYGVLTAPDLEVTYQSLWPLIFAVGLTLASMVMGYLRLQLLLGGVGVRVSVSDSVRIGFIGAFFNSFLLGSLSGDAVKFVYLSQVAPRRAVVASGLLLDRLLGLGGLLLLAAAASIWMWTDFAHVPGFERLGVWIIGVLVGLVVIGSVSLVSILGGRRAALALLAVQLLAIQATMYLLPGVINASSVELVWAGCLIIAVSLAAIGLVPSLEPGGRLNLWFSRRGGIARSAIAVIEAVLHYRHRCFLLGTCLALSVILQGTGVLSLYYLGLALGIADQPSVVQVGVAGPVAMVTNSLPIPCGGLGVGEAAFDNILRHLPSGGHQPSQSGAAIFFVLRLITIVLGFIGVPFYLFSRRNRHDNRSDAYPDRPTQLNDIEPSSRLAA